MSKDLLSCHSLFNHRSKRLCALSSRWGWTQTKETRWSSFSPPTLWPSWEWGQLSSTSLTTSPLTLRWESIQQYHNSLVYNNHNGHWAGCVGASTQNNPCCRRAAEVGKISSSKVLFEMMTLACTQGCQRVSWRSCGDSQDHCGGWGQVNFVAKLKKYWFFNWPSPKITLYIYRDGSVSKSCYLDPVRWAIFSYQMITIQNCKKFLFPAGALWFWRKMEWSSLGRFPK